MRYVLRPFALWWRYFPQLAALYLLGWLGRKGAIELAAYVGWDNDVWASLIMPFAGLARLGSYVAMFLVLRPAIPVLAALPRRSARSVDVFANIIVPFFAIYLAWKLFAEDWLEFETAALDYRVADSMTTALTTGQSSGGLHPDELPISGVTWAIIAAALVARYVAGIVYGVSMPDWRDVARRVVGDRADMVFERGDASRRRLSERGWRVDTDVATRFAGWARARMGNYSNIVDSARLILHGGVLAITLYICSYLVLAWLDMAGAFYRPEVSIGYLFRSVAWLFGPHPITFWNGFADTIALVSHVIVEPLRVCLIAATVAYCLEQVGVEDDETTKAAAP